MNPGRTCPFPTLSACSSFSSSFEPFHRKFQTPRIASHFLHQITSLSLSNFGGTLLSLGGFLQRGTALGLFGHHRFTSLHSSDFSYGLGILIPGGVHLELGGKRVGQEAGLSQRLKPMLGMDLNIISCNPTLCPVSHR